MLLVTLCSLIGVVIYELIKVCADKKIGSLFGLIPMFILVYVLNYWSMPPLQLATILGQNILWLLVYGIISEIVTYATTDGSNNSTPAISLVSMIVLAVLVRGGISINSSWNVHHSYNTIQYAKNTSKKAPTMKRGETPVAIPPKTVFYKVGNDFGSNVPHYNSLEFAQSNDGDSAGDSTQIQAQFYHGKPVYIVPIQFKSFFRWAQFREIPGYFRMSATNPNASPHFVKKPIRYGDNMPFHHNVERNIYRKFPEYRSLSGTAQLEIDEKGHPYFVETLFKPTQTNTRPNFSHLHIAVENAETGHVKLYHSMHTPKFINENLTSSVADSMNNYYGHYKHGLLNYMLWGKNGVEDPTENGPEDGVTTIFNPNKTISYVTDFTSVNNSTTDIGSSAVNARTGKLTYYSTPGIMDSNRAEDNANRSFQYRHWSADMPVLYDIDGHATWVMSILDQSDLQRDYYYVEGKDASINTYDSTAKSCLDDFKRALVSNGSKVSNSSSIKEDKQHGTVSRCFISSSKVLFMLNGSHKVYTINANNYTKAHFLKPGDNVKFKSGANGVSGMATDFTDSNL